VNASKDVSEKTNLAKENVGAGLAPCPICRKADTDFIDTVVEN
jgi:hypothetical protein